LLAPVMLGLSHLFTMNVFDLVFWIAIAWLVVRIAKSGDERLWIPVGALIGVAILNKYAILFWISGLVVGIVVTPMRRSFRPRFR